MPRSFILSPVFPGFLAAAYRVFAFNGNIDRRDVSQMRCWNNVELHCAASANCKQRGLRSPYVAPDIQASVFAPVRPKLEGRAHLDRAKHAVHKDHFQRSPKAVRSPWLRCVIRSHMQPCSPELIYHRLNIWRIFLELPDDVRLNSERSIVPALLSVNA